MPCTVRNLFVLFATFAFSFSGSAIQATTLPVTSGLVLHLDASDPLNNGGVTLPSNGSSPTSWLDTSGLSHNAGSKASDPNWFANGGAAFNNRPVFRFDGNDAYLVGSTANVDTLGVHGAAAATIITVINPQGNTLSGSTRWFGNTGAGNDFFGQLHSGNTNTLSTAGTGTNIGTNFTVNGPNNLSNVTDTHILASIHSRFLRVLYDNGLAGVSDTSDWGAATTISANSQKGVGVFESGGSISASTYYTGDIAEIIVFNRALSPLELNEVGVYLQQKYGVNGQFALPAPEPSMLALLGWGGLMLVQIKKRRGRKIA